MVKVIAIHTRKGGVGKTTIATNLALATTHLLEKGVLMIDLDPQGNSSLALRSHTEVELGKRNKAGAHIWFDLEATPEDLEATILNKKDIKKNFYLVSGNQLLEDVDKKISNKKDSDKILVTNIAKMISSGKFKQLGIDVILIDLSPAFNNVTRNAYLAAQNGVIQVLEPTVFSLSTLDLNLKTWEEEMKAIGMKSNIKAILLNRAKAGVNTRDMYEHIHNKYPDIALNTLITENIRTANSVVAGKPWMIWDLKSKEWKKPQWISKNEFMNSRVKDGSQIINLVEELQAKKVL